MSLSRREVCDVLGATIIREIRDEACQHLQWVISGDMNDSASRWLFSEYKKLDHDSARVLQRFLTVAVDATLARCLNYLDESKAPLVIQTPGGGIVDARQASDGLVGELYNESGWIARFSRFGETIEPVQ